MALGNYAELKTAVASWLNRSDLTSAIPDFVALAEADIRRDVRVQAMESIASGTLTGETLAAPDRLIEVRRLVVGSTSRVFNYVTPEQYQVLSAQSATWPVFTIVGTNLYILAGSSGTSYSLMYSAAFAAFSADGDTNALLTSHPDVYLAGACKYGAIYLRDDAEAAKYGAMYQAAVAKSNRQARATSHGGTLQVRAA